MGGRYEYTRGHYRQVFRIDYIVDNGRLHFTIDNDRLQGDRTMNTYTADDLVLCRSADGFSVHAPGSMDEDIANGNAPYLVAGPGEPTDADYERALEILSGAAGD